MKYLIVGLGNIGAEYELTRHNIGFMVADFIAEKHNAAFTHGKLANTALVRYKSRQITIIKPTTYMNLSGKAVNYWLNYLKVPMENLLIITDDIALPFEKIRIRQKGSSAGHNGLNSIEELIGNNYPRLRIGIGNNFYKGQQVDFVLSQFNKEELSALPHLIQKAADAVLSFCTIGTDRTMNEFNS
ncbi:MAG: aminoacyl-tRNA hydrolase [Cyclobacteriaceae bacterium]|nr:aminoacyl-tRNA hydrolase [Cyclobacteriaceae bacterium]